MKPQQNEAMTFRNRRKQSRSLLRFLSFLLLARSELRSNDMFCAGILMIDEGTLQFANTGSVQDLTIGSGASGNDCLLLLFNNPG